MDPVATVVGVLLGVCAFGLAVLGSRLRQLHAETRTRVGELWAHFDKYDARLAAIDSTLDEHGESIQEARDLGALKL